jgi:hypothetical protein
MSLCPGCKAGPDLTVRNEGSIFLLRATSDAGHEWISEHIPEDAQTFCGSIVVEHRYIENIVAGAMADGLAVQ